MNYSALLDKMVVFLVLMVIGYVMARRGILNRDFVKAASSLTLNVFLSGSILNSVISVDLGLGWAELGRVFLVVWVMQILGYLVAYLVSRLVPTDRERRPVFELLMSMGNSMFIGLPIVQSLFGPEAVFYVSLSCIPFNVILYSYGVWRLQSGREDSKLRLKDILCMPLIATLLSLVLFLTHPPVPSAVRGLLGALAGATMPMSMLVIGATLGSVSLLDAFRNGRLYIMSLVRLLVIPVLTWFVCGLLTDDPVLLLTMVIVAACPSAVVITVMANQYERDSVFTAEGTLQSTALSMVTIPLLVYVLGNL